MSTVHEILKQAVEDWDMRWPPSRGYVEAAWVTDARAALQPDSAPTDAPQGVISGTAPEEQNLPPSEGSVTEK